MRNSSCYTLSLRVADCSLVSVSNGILSLFYLRGMLMFLNLSRSDLTWFVPKFSWRIFFIVISWIFFYILLSHHAAARLCLADMFFWVIFLSCPGRIFSGFTRIFYSSCFSFRCPSISTLQNNCFLMYVILRTLGNFFISSW